LTGCPATPPAASTAAAPAAQPVVTVQPTIVVQPTVVSAPVVADPAGLIYYPNYEVYYDPGTSVYWYNNDGRWNSGPTPFGVSVDTLHASPSARMNFHDSPETHHAQVTQQFPHGWQPSDQPDSGRDRRGQ
jgi:hypothetical protein